MITYPKFDRLNMWVNDEKMGFVQCNQHLIVASLIYVPVGNLKMREENQAWKLIIRRRNKKCNTQLILEQKYMKDCHSSIHSIREH